MSLTRGNKMTTNINFEERDSGCLSGKKELSIETKWVSMKTTIAVR
jgi:hypothetical protein